MKKLLLFSFLIFSMASWAQVTIEPFPFAVDEEITITVDANSNETDCNGLSNPSKVYLHSGIGTDVDPWTTVVGNWGQDDGVGEMTDNGDGTWSITFVPETYYGLTADQANNATQMGMVFRNAAGTQELKDNGCNDFFFDVGSFQLQLNNPTENLTLLNPGESLSIQATSSVAADFTLAINGSIVDTFSGTDYSYDHSNITENSQYTLEAESGGETRTQNFMVVVNVVEEAVPVGMLDGLNLDPLDDTSATLVLYAPGKEIVHLIGDFNNWTLSDEYLLKKDSAQDRFWIQLTGLTPQTNHMYQYVVDGEITIADPYSTLILDEDNDPYINNTTYPNLPAYPSGQTEHAVTVLRTGDPDYAWANNSYTLPSKTDLVVYELLIRDFDELHSFDAVRARLDYLQELGVNAIELMPVSEFDGNESWGYNPSFHMALDKYYGNADAFKQLVDECHGRGMAVILDVVFNHATGQNPYYRLWNTDNGGYNGVASNDSPFFNAAPTHSYNVFNDFNHSQQATQDYVKRVAQYWIDEYKIDGYRWDLTKGFTQNCTENDEGCTGSYQADRVAVLKEYADYQWEVNEDFLVIFEHLGTNEEETEWAEYRLDEGKGIMLWGNLNGPYSEAAMGWNTNSDFSWISYVNRGWTVPSNVSYMESHDEERMMYRNLNFGNASGDYNTQDLATALDRVKLAGAFFFTVPGPKMIWQFGELGYDYSIDYNGRIGNKPIRWDYFDNPDRKAVYDTWSDLNLLAVEEPIFETSDFEMNVANSNGLKTIHLTNASAGVDEIGFVTIIGNFGVVEQEIDPQFQETGVWYEFLANNLKYVVTNVNETITLAPGEYRIFGNNPTSLFPNDNPPDADSDGVLDANDLCPDTPLDAVVNVDGCEVFSLPENNFSVLTNSETCRGSNNGSITITALEVLTYTATLSGTAGASINFDATATFENLSAGNYELCITVSGESDYQQCYTLTITEPESLEVYSEVDKDTNILSLALKGGEYYNIQINDETYLTASDSFDLKLNQSVNTLKISTDMDCQGVFEETLLLTDRAMAYPNPMIQDNQVSVDLGFNTNEELNVQVFDLNGRLHASKVVQTNFGKLNVDLSGYANGFYLIKVTGKEIAHEFKIIKQ
ncbi:alpha-amylase family glycosyl hydrolase [Flagellimonas zhangzhouensis]|uniref:Por secretion system C-terminal sorting domain-containing protein n=1 Tax=Flagellimonas zhangzhouensis TaxID=1073328 RepID=A0A1H2QR09_9FLAO|nr:alpha-amylase family glycosyl hydrolase [Allomuricauda zhangzhouensis]SDQ55937.1 Por secretion system C-terminal sorting domain-containing protein [Allomuricauda zhangzhouensis]SDW09602.1 Por secretion system C-terminal sorting domain-containing protein [Allomuricauda zhangzhouensis]